MALLTDALFPTPADINAEEPALNGALSTNCGVSGISLTTLCSQAYTLCGQIIASKLQSVIGATNFNPSGGATSLHNGAVIWGVRAQSNVVRLRLGQIVVSDLYIGDGPNPVAILGPLHSWLVSWAITLGYRKTMGSVEASLDRQKIKYDIYYKLTAGEKWSILRSTGVPYVRVPFPAPGALYEPGQGVWSTNNLTQVTAGGAQGGNFVVAITWVDQTSTTMYISPLIKNNSESGPSKVFPNQYPNGLPQILVTSGNAIQISIASLTPPNGAVSLPEASITGVAQGTHIATGWNVYVGLANDPNNIPNAPLYLQNALPIPVGTMTYTLAGDPVLSGYQLGPGQYPDANMPMGDLMMRC